MLFHVDPALNFTFPPFPTELRFGCGLSSEIGAMARELGSSRVLLVTDAGIVKAGVARRLTEPLETAGLQVLLFDEVMQDSSSGMIMRAAALAKERGVDLIVGLGGGSALDSAKAIAAMATNPGSILDWVGLDRVPLDPLPCICVPTAAGTGSEVSVWSVLTDDATGAKASVGGTRVMARIALCDPELTVSLPPAVTAATGMDALGHAVECYVNKACQPVSGALALQAIALIGRHLRRAVADGTSLEARSGMLMAAVLAGIAMNPTRLGLAHALAMPLGSWNLKIPHGTIIAITLPEVMAFNCSAAPDRYAAVAAALGEDTAGLEPEAAARKAVDAVRSLKADTGIPEGLSACGFTPEWSERVVEEAMKSGNVAVNPRATSPADLTTILQKAM